MPVRYLIVDDEAPGRTSENFFACQGAAAAFDKVQALVGFVRAVYINVHRPDFIKGRDFEALLFKKTCGRPGT